MALLAGFSDTEGLSATSASSSSFSLIRFLQRQQSLLIASCAMLAIILWLLFRFVPGFPATRADVPLYVALFLGGLPLVIQLLGKALRREFGSDLLAGISIVTSVILHEYLAGTIVVLMLSGGEALERYAIRSASSVLSALARRMPSIAHRRKEEGSIEDVDLADVAVGDVLVVYPHDVCPADGVVTGGHGTMDESYLTGEPFQMTKTCGSQVISGAVNGSSALVIRVVRKPSDSRYARIMAVMRESEQKRPRLRRLGDSLGAIYTPAALGVAGMAWLISGDPVRFLSVLVIATPCPLLIAIPVALIGAISLSARRAIIVKNPAVLEQISSCRTAIFDKTGTLTYGEPVLTEVLTAPAFTENEVIGLCASLERYSKHPLAGAVVDAASRRSLSLNDAASVSELPGQGLSGVVNQRHIRITSRRKIENDQIWHLPRAASGLECVVLIDEAYAAVLRFRDSPRADGISFVRHLMPRHGFERLMIVSGDRESEVSYLAHQVGITEIRAQASPEEKLAIVREETAMARTLYVGDGINDAPAMMSATVGMAMGSNSDVTAEAADVVVMDSSLKKVDEFMHISRHMKTVALQSAIGGMALSLIGMGLASAGFLTPVTGAIGQEVIDVIAVLNALRAAWPPRVMSDL